VYFIFDIVSFVFRQIAAILMARSSPNRKIDNICPIWKEKPSRIPFRFKKKKSFESHAQSSRKLLVDTWQGGGEYFHETFVRHHRNITKYIVFIVFLWFMINTINICVVLSTRSFREDFAWLSNDFFFILNLNGIREGFSFQMGQMLSIFRFGLFYNEVLLDTVI
jgi:hypothetical protein